MMLIGDLKKKLVEYMENKLGDEPRIGGIVIEEPRNRDFGDLSTNAAMVLAPVMKKSPMDIARVIVDEAISGWEEVEDISIAKPGFINFKLKTNHLVEVLKEIEKDRESYGKNNIGRGTRVQLEYVSSNPTGDLHIGHGRWGALGDTLANIYKANGYEVQKEYYVNDHGSQAEKFTQCAEALYLEHFKREADYPEDGYPREIVAVAVQSLIEKHKDSFLSGNFAGFKQEIIKIMADHIGETLGMMGVKFDRWFYESSLYEEKNFEKKVKDLKEKDLVYENEGALWFRSSKYGDEKDRDQCLSRS